MGDYNSTGT